ncbi:MAG: YggS family pyridoxal phosphate-dependent enzyme [Verrucomicrobiales bacterium]|nr:YggS family pyridoxal phosphate-dependent enzyme [Verrucomicrobiales bacterium]
MSIAENLEQVRGQITEATAKAGRNAGEVTLVAVSKTWPVEVIQEVVDAGQFVLGENKVQEILEKVPVMSADLKWHCIGHLQKNKVRKVLPLCAMIHSIDSVDLAERVDRIAGELDLHPEVLLQVNVADDDAKFGFSVAELEEAFYDLSALANLRIKGLMTVPAFDPDPEAVRPFFARLRELRDRIEDSSKTSLPHLSMGMSHDFPVAIEEGATLVRVGSSIFGKRDYPV